MRGLMIAVLAMGVGGCSTLGFGPRVAKTPEQIACEARSNDDPEVKLLIMKGAGSTQFQEDNQNQLRQARNRFVRGCLEQRGAVRPGGVERQRPL